MSDTKILKVTENIVHDRQELRHRIKCVADPTYDDEQCVLGEVKALKAEKNELRDEKQKLKVEKEQLEQQVKAMTVTPSFVPHPAAIQATFAAQGQAAAGNKLMPFIGYPGVAMWQFMPPAAVDTSQDHVLRPPVA
ncbi:hypothetical protein ACLOJK_039626 [Asimina triloba]